jgi:hypothetical protein
LYFITLEPCRSDQRIADVRCLQWCLCRNVVKASERTVEVLPWRLFDQSCENSKTSAWNAGRSCDVCCVENSEKTNQSISLASQEIPRMLWNPKFYCFVCMRPPLLLIVSQLNPGEPLKYCLRFVTNQCPVQDALRAALVTD